MSRRIDATKRDSAFAAPFVLLALGAIGYGVYRLIASPPASWTMVLVVLVSVVICGSLWLHVGRAPGFPVIGVAVTMLAFPPVDESPLLGVCIWTFGVFASQTIMRRNLRYATYTAGLSAVAAWAFVTIQLALTAAGVWLLPSFLVAATAYYTLFLLGEVLRRWVHAPSNGFEASVVSLPKVGLVVLVVAITASLMHYVDGVVVPWLEREPGASRTPFVLLLAASLFYVFAQQARYADIERRLSAVVGAAVELPQETGDALASALLIRARTTVQACQVDLVERAPERDEIGSPVSLEPGLTRFLVASREAGGAPFTREDERSLATLAHLASEAARVQYEVNSLEQRANSDPLTGLPNYGAFQQALLDANEHRPYHEGIALLFIDLDDFKRLNDNYGHRVGDELLRVVADRLRDAAGGGDFVSRVGGDEFVVILSDLVSVEQAKESAERIVEAASRPLDLEGVDIRPAISAGLSYSSHRELDAQTLVEDADRAMLRVKRSRHGAGQSEGPRVGVSSHRSTRTNDIVARAIGENRLSVAFQPIVDLCENRIWAFEALVRYTDPELGPISPPSLVARAKSLGLMNDLTRQVITRSLEAAEEFRSLEPGIGCMTVNLELGQITEAELGPFIRDAASAHPDISFCIELNERSLRAATDDLRRDAERMQEAGMIIALDDYGSDDSPVGALVHFPMNVLKIDKSLISDLGDPRQREVVKALQGFGDNLHYTMIVEGVETADMVAIMRGLGVRNAQGYYYGRPLPLRQTLDRLRRSGARADAG